MAKSNFTEIIKEYNPAIASEIKGIFTGAEFKNKNATKANILTTIIGFIVGLFTGIGFFSTTDPETGWLVLTDGGLIFLATTAEKIKGSKDHKISILNHYLMPYSQMKKAKTSRTLIYGRQLHITGTYKPQPGHREGDYSVTIPHNSDEISSLEALKVQLKTNGIKIKKGRAAMICGLLLVAILVFVLFFIFVPSWTNSYRAMDYAQFRREINTPASTASGMYQRRTTSFSARIETDVFSIEFENGQSRDFVAATVAGNERVFLVEVGDDRTGLMAGEIANIRAIGEGVIITRPLPDETFGDRFFRRIGEAFGDPRISGVVAEVSNAGVLSGINYLHMRMVDFEIIAPLIVVDSDTFVSSDGNYQINFVEAYHTTAGVANRQTDVIMIYYDYEAFAAHNPNRPFTRNFVVYQGDVELEFWDGGLRAEGYRNFLSTHNFSPGEVFHARRAVVPVGPTDTLRIVRYNENFQVIFSHEVNVRPME